MIRVKNHDQKMLPNTQLTVAPQGVGIGRNPAKIDQSNETEKRPISPLECAEPRNLAVLLAVSRQRIETAPRPLRKKPGSHCHRNMPMNASQKYLYRDIGYFALSSPTVRTPFKAVKRATLGSIVGP
jgi:hypothetical protein